MLNENVFRSPASKMTEPEKFFRVFTGNAVNFVWNEKYKPVDPLKYTPQSGDVLLSRGAASVSAAIARITDEDSNFSHAGIVYVDPVTKKVETVEAHIEFGTLLADIKDYSDTKARAVLFRFRDPAKTTQENADLAHEAASKIRQIIIDYKKKYGRTKYPNPCYDFTMNIDNPQVMVPSDDPKIRKCLFCSEVVSLAFSLIDGGKYKIPTYMSSLNPKNKKFLTDIGVTATSTFAPADLEIEPYFEMVMEWRDYTRIHKTHVMDAILTSMYTWMDQYNYQFYVPLKINLATTMAHGVRHMPLLDRWTGLDKKFPINMAPAALNTMVMLDEVSNQLADVIYESEQKLNSDLTPGQMIGVLEDWRIQDLADYTKDPKSYNSKNDPLKKHRIHHILRAR